MEITYEQYKKLKPYLPKQRGNVKIDNFTLINALLYAAENGGKWRKLPKEYGKWHTIYMRVNRWSKSGVLDRIPAALQKDGIINVEVLCLDSTTVKVHPDACKKVENRQSEGNVADLLQKST